MAQVRRIPDPRAPQSSSTQVGPARVGCTERGLGTDSGKVGTVDNMIADKPCPEGGDEHSTPISEDDRALGLDHCCKHGPRDAFEGLAGVGIVRVGG